MKIKHVLTNRDIKEQYSKIELHLIKPELLGTLASWLIQQSPYDCPNITKAVKAYDKFLSVKFDTVDAVKKFTYKELSDYISEEVFESIPEIEIFNHSKKGDDIGFIRSSSRYHKTKADYDFIDLSALSRNVFYSICRNNITQPL